MTYAHVVMWLWVVALGTTLGALFVAARALARTDASVARLSRATDAVQGVPSATATLDRAIGDAAFQRTTLGTRATPSP